MKSLENTPSAQVLQKTQPEDFDLVMLGGGTGSTIAAWTFAGQGQRVAVIERQYIGGSCPNIACLPSKNIIHSAKVASYFRRSHEFGIAHDGFTIAMSGVRDRRRTNSTKFPHTCWWSVAATSVSSCPRRCADSGVPCR